jgi:single-strand DNA-binding protein
VSDDINKVFLSGNLGADPELRYTQGGQAVLNLRLATTSSYFDKDKVRRERTEWTGIVVWGKRGEALSKILNKGTSITVEGRLQTSTYDDREGNKRHKVEIVADNIVLGGKGKRDASEDAPPERGGYQRSGAPRGRQEPEAPIDDAGGGYGGGETDIPFVCIGAAPESGDHMPRSWL